MDPYINLEPNHIRAGGFIVNFLHGKHGRVICQRDFIDDIEAELDDGQEITLIAIPEHGFVFRHWIVIYHPCRDGNIYDHLRILPDRQIIKSSQRLTVTRIMNCFIKPAIRKFINKIIRKIKRLTVQPAVKNPKMTKQTSYRKNFEKHTFDITCDTNIYAKFRPKWVPGWMYDICLALGRLFR